MRSAVLFCRAPAVSLGTMSDMLPGISSRIERTYHVGGTGPVLLKAKATSCSPHFLKGVFIYLFIYLFIFEDSLPCSSFLLTPVRAPLSADLVRSGETLVRALRSRCFAVSCQSGCEIGSGMKLSGGGRIFTSTAPALPQPSPLAVRFVLYRPRPRSPSLALALTLT